MALSPELEPSDTPAESVSPAQSVSPAESIGPVDAAAERDPEVTGEASVSEAGFRVSLSNFDGPFDLLLNLISKHEMDITEVSLSAVTNLSLIHI